MIKTCIKYKLHTYVCYFEDLKIIDMFSLVSLYFFFFFLTPPLSKSVITV